MKDTNRETTDNIKRKGFMNSTTRRRIVIGGTTAVAGLAAVGVAGAVQGNAEQPSPSGSPGRGLAGRFNQKVVLITGATSGIGRVTAEAFAREGAKVVFCGRRVTLGEQVQNEIKRAGGEALYVRADVTVPADIIALVDTTVKTYGRLDIAFNNAGFEGSLAPMHETTMENWDVVMNTNLRGVWLSMKAEIPQMRKQGSGAIINTASVQGLAANPEFTAYTASKHGILGLTKTAALENAARNIRVNAVAPGPIDTAMTNRTLNGDAAIRRQLENRVPVKRIGRPEEVARAVLWLASDESPFVTGTFLTIDGGIIAQE